MRQHAIAFAVSGALLGLAGSAQADTKTANFNVTANVVANCVIAAQPVNFGDFDGSVDKLAQGDVTVRCTAGTPYEVELSAGSSNNFLARTMQNGANSLTYNLYTTAGFGTIWGDGTTDGTGSATGAGTGLSAAETKTHTVYGRLLAAGNEDAPVAPYSDTITATVVY